MCCNDEAIPSARRSSVSAKSWASRSPSTSTGNRSSFDRQDRASLRLACSGRPLNSESMNVQPSSAVMAIARSQYRMAARRSSSSGPDQPNSSSTEARETPASLRACLKAWIDPGARMNEERSEVVAGRQLDVREAEARGRTRRLGQDPLRNMYGSRASYVYLHRPLAAQVVVRCIEPWGLTPGRPGA